MKTKEELKALKNEVEAMNAKLAELSDDELENISGGSFYPLEFYRTPEEVHFVHNIGDEVEVETIFGFGTTVRCKITDIKAEYYEIHNTGAPGVVGTTNMDWGYVDMYYCEELIYHWHFPNDWKLRNAIEK